MSTVTYRPHFGEYQIRSSREIKLGDKVIPVYFYDKEYEEVTVIGYFTCDTGLFGVDMKKGFIVKNSGGFLEHMFYSDKGLEAYSSGRWSKSNWLKFADKKGE